MDGEELCLSIKGRTRRIQIFWLQTFFTVPFCNSNLEKKKCGNVYKNIFWSCETLFFVQLRCISFPCRVTTEPYTSSRSRIWNIDVEFINEGVFVPQINITCLSVCQLFPQYKLLAAFFNNQWSLCCTQDLGDFMCTGPTKANSLMPSYQEPLWHSARCLLRSACDSTFLSRFQDRQSLSLKPHLFCLSSLVLFLSL